MMHPIESSLSERQRRILAIIIEEYVSNARPVASEYIQAHYTLNVSPATVRNDMVELERAGFISQPHTSSGRVPSDKGYRFFVENLMTPSALPANEQRKIRHQFHQIESDIEEWVRLAASVMSRQVHSAALATAPRSIAVHLKHFEVLSVAERRVLIVLVGQDGTIHQQIITFEEGWDQERLSALTARLNPHFQGMTAREITDWLKQEENTADLPQVAREVLLPTLIGMLSRLERSDTAQVYHEGLSHMLEQPEFHDPARAHQLVELFEHGNVWSSLVSSVLTQEGVQVIIGDEGRGSGMGACGMVLARYGLEDQLTGVLGVVGPIRMPYGRSVSTVQYMSQLLSDLLYRAFNPQLPGGEDQ